MHWHWTYAVAIALFPIYIGFVLYSQVLRIEMLNKPNAELPKDAQFPWAVWNRDKHRGFAQAYRARFPNDRLAFRSGAAFFIGMAAFFGAVWLMMGS